METFTSPSPFILQHRQEKRDKQATQFLLACLVFAFLVLILEAVAFNN